MKPWYKSTTIWANVGAFVTALVPIAASQLSDVIGAEAALQVSTILGLVAAVLNLAIRTFMTSAPIQRPGS